MGSTMKEDELLERARSEREKIFERYDKGRVPGNIIEEWEDADFPLYYQTDRYGFIHDEKLPLKKDPNEQKAKQIEMERVKKWLKMLNSWNKKETKEKLHKRIYKGIPDKLRSNVWMKLLNVDEVMERSQNKNKYQEMLQLARQWSTEVRQIDSDVNRQFREHVFYRERYNVKQKSLFNVLVAYSMYNSEVGYCQGMSTLAGMLLMYMNEEEAFWSLSILISDKKYAMHGLFIEGFPKLTRFLAHHDKILAKFVPKLKKHFDNYTLDSILYCLKWFFVIFVERIPFSLCLRVWDVYLLDGEKTATAMAYCVLKLHKNKLLKLKDMDSIVHYLQVKLQKDFGYDDDTVIKSLEQCMDELRKAKMDLPPPGDENEFPKRPFGVFVEPTKDEKIGHRRSNFTPIEKDVTDTVITKREQMAKEAAEEKDNMTEVGAGYGGSNSQLNTVQIPESEDGGSLLGSSKRSLADTSVTSTADLSIFSGGGQKSQQQYDLYYDNSNSGATNDNSNFNCSDIDLHIIEKDDEEEEDGESSPNSAFGSVPKSSSTIHIYPKDEIGVAATKMMQEENGINGKMERFDKEIEDPKTPKQSSNQTTTPQVSPQDVVRIYVPPAPMEELNDRLKNIQVKSNNDEDQLPRSGRSSIIHLEYENPPLILESPPKRVFTPLEQQQRIQQLFEEESQTYPSFTAINSEYNNGINSTSTPNSNSRQTPQQYYYYPTPSAMPTMPTMGPPQVTSVTSPVRRGSLTRKSPSPMRDVDIVVETEHYSYEPNRPRRSMSTCSNGTSVRSESRSYQFNTDYTEKPIKRMTSFEELAQKARENAIVYISPSKERFEDSDRGQDEIIEERIVYKRKNSKPKSDYNIQYKNFENADDVDDYNDYRGRGEIRKSTSHSYSIKNSGSRDRKHSSSDNSPFDYDLLKEKRKEDRYTTFGTEGGSKMGTNEDIKSYNRFFNDEDEDDEDETQFRHGKKPSITKYTRTVTGNEADEETDDNGRILIRKSSDENDDENSSNSPPSKSILSTPINETIPLLMGDQIQGGVTEQSPGQTGSSSFRKNNSKIPRYNRNSSNNNSFNKHSSISSPEEDDRSDRNESFYLKKEALIQNSTKSSWSKHDNRLAQTFGGGTYQSYSTPPASLQQRQSNTRRSTGGISGIPGPGANTPSSKNEANKIRIKINQKN